MPAHYNDEILAAERPVSIRDIAARAGVSHTTVSRALHDNPLISRDVRERIQQIALEMGYVPNEVAQSLKQSQTHSVGLVVTSIADPFVGRVVRGIEESAQAAHMSVILSVSDNQPEQEMAVIENFNRAAWMGSSSRPRSLICTIYSAWSNGLYRWC